MLLAYSGGKYQNNAPSGGRKISNLDVFSFHIKLHIVVVKVFFLIYY